MSTFCTVLYPKLVHFHVTRSYVNEEGRVVADPNILTDLLYGAPTNHRDIKVILRSMC